MALMAEHPFVGHEVQKAVPAIAGRSAPRSSVAQGSQQQRRLQTRPTTPRGGWAGDQRGVKTLLRDLAKADLWGVPLENGRNFWAASVGRSMTRLPTKRPTVAR